MTNQISLASLQAFDPRWTFDIWNKYLLYRNKVGIVARTGRTAHRDSAKTKVYRSEWEFIRTLGSGIKFATQKEADTYLKRVVASKTYEKLRGNKNAYVVMTQRRRSVYAGRAYWDGKITLDSACGMNEYTLLHELAHQCGNMHHDVSFRQAVVALVSRFMGRAQAKVREKTFKDFGLKMKLRTKVRDPEVWLNAYFRMKEARTKL